MQKIAINSSYPFPINEGLTASFLSQSGNVLQLGLHDIDQQELLALKKHPIKCGIFVDQPVILLLFDFGAGGQYDAPFDARLYTREQLNLLNIDNAEQRLAIEFHVVELKNNTIKVIRLFTLPPDLTVNFLAAVQEQLSKPLDKNLYNQKLNLIYQKSFADLLALTHLYKAGT